MTFQMKININGKLTHAIDIQKGKATEIVQPALAGDEVVFELVDKDTGRAPESIVTKRSGNDLEITFENSDKPELIIKNYYSNNQTSPIVGLAEDGQFYPYIPESGLEKEAIGVLNEGVLASEVLGAGKKAIVPFVWEQWAWGTLAVAAATGVALAVSGGGES